MDSTPKYWRLPAAPSAVLIVVIWLFLHGHKQIAAPLPQPIPVEPAATAPTPEPELPAMRLSSDSATGKVAFDDQPPVDLQDAQWTLEKIPSGDHTLKFDSAAGSLSFILTSAAGSLPVVKTPIAAKGVLAAVVSSMGDHVHVYSSDTGAKLSLDGQPTIDIPAEGADLSSVTAGAHELTISRGGEQYKLAIEVAAAPALNAFVESGQNVGTLVVVTGQDKSRVFLNGKALPQETRGGQLRVANLEPKEYVVKVSKSGYQDAPEQKIRIRKGEQGRLVFGLFPVPRTATLIIQGGPPGATVLIDQANAGTVQPDGTLTVSAVVPGDHVVELRKDRFKPKQFKKHFVVGTPVTLAAADTALETAPGELKITFTPADAQLTLTKPGDPPVKLSNGTALSLPAGTYTLAAHTADNFVRTVLVGTHCRTVAEFRPATGPQRNVEVGRPFWLETGKWCIRS